MSRLETDDEIAASACIREESTRRFRSACASNIYFKRRICGAMVGAGTRGGTVDQCVRDRAVQGRTVRRGGVGG